MTTLLYEDLGHMEYQAAIALQEKPVVLRQQELAGDTLLFVEHPHVYTLGRGGNEANVLAPKDVHSAFPPAQTNCGLRYGS